LDLFCGLGNFTLPLARRAGQVVGFEGDEKLVQRARENASHNGITNAEFHAADLNLMMDSTWVGRGFNKILLDPPRTGALEIVKRLPELGASRIVYVSCNPATLARDAAELVHQHGYRMISAGVMDMFPHTTHVESIALFEKF
jgi:23S rRNA (uracil1939-C5)-methyltransferase